MVDVKFLAVRGRAHLNEKRKQTCAKRRSEVDLNAAVLVVDQSVWDMGAENVFHEQAVSRELEDVALVRAPEAGARQDFTSIGAIPSARRTR